MFESIYFYFDENGKPLKENYSRQLTAKQCNCHGFTARSQDGDVVRIYRSGLIDAKNDRFNADGSPPTCMFAMHSAKIQLSDNMVIVNGFEEHNLSMAGLLLEGYDEENRPLAAFATAHRKYNYGPDYGRYIPQSSYPQSIILSTKR